MEIGGKVNKDNFGGNAGIMIPASAEQLTSLGIQDLTKLILNFVQIQKKFRRIFMATRD
jgi:hypothetical protein